MKRYGISPSFRLTVCLYLFICLLLWVQQVGDIDRLMNGWRRSSTGLQYGMQQQMWAVPRFQRT